MCGRYNVIDSLEIRLLMEQLKLPGTLPTSKLNVPPGGSGEFVIEATGDRHLLTGIWSLLIEPRPTGTGCRPNPKFQTFNARSDRLTSSPLWRKAYPSKRCIVPVSAFHEWKGKQVYNIHPKSIPLMLRPDDFDLWLDPDFHQVDAFQKLMKTHIPAPLVCEPVQSPDDLRPAGSTELLAAD